MRVKGRHAKANMYWKGMSKKAERKACKGKHALERHIIKGRKEGMQRQTRTGSCDGLKVNSYTRKATIAPVHGPTQKIQ